MEKIRIAILSHTEYQSAEKEAEALLKLSTDFGENETNRLKAIKNKRARVASLCGLAALSALVGDKCGVICRNASGKPYFEDSSLGCFSISHSGTLSVAAHGALVIGVDVECIDKARNFCGIADRFFTERELDIFHKSGDTAERFFEIWTKKEAYVKYLGGAFASLYSKDASGVMLRSFRFEYQDSEYILTLCSADKTELDILNKDVSLKAL